MRAFFVIELFMTKIENLKKVKAKWIIRLPDHGKNSINIKKGDTVSAGEVVVSVEDVGTYYIDLVGLLKGWSTEKISQWKAENVGKKFSKGSVVLESGGLFPKKILAEKTGVLLDIDEFGRAKFSYSDGVVRKILAPVDSKITKIEDGKAVLSFDAFELKGDGNSKGKVWGDICDKLFSESTNMKSELENKIIFVDKVDQVKLTKAEVIGVSGVVVVIDSPINWDDYMCDLPAMVISYKKYQEMNQKGILDGARVMLNSNTGRFLVVVQ